jgi:hypothetical protein
VSINFRKLAAIDVAFLGPKLIVTEFAFGVLFSLALGIFALLRAHSLWGTAVGTYLVCPGINYGPMLGYAVAIGNRENARLELGDELKEKQVAMSKYRRQSLLLLVPLVVPIFAIFRRAPRASAAHAR